MCHEGVSMHIRRVYEFKRACTRELMYTCTRVLMYEGVNIRGC